MDDMVTRVVEVLDEVGVCNTTDEEYYKTIKLNELSPDLLGRYKTKAAVQAKALDKKGKYKKANKRFTGITRATNKQFSNDRDEYEKERQRKQDAYARNITYDTARHKSKTKYRNVDVSKRNVELKPAKTTGELDDYEKDKERKRKDVKQRHPNVPLKWNGHRWTLKSKGHEDHKRRIEEKYDLVPLYEISLRTVAIGGYLAKVKQYANKVDTTVTKMKSLASDLSRADTPEKKTKIESELWKTDADVLLNMRKMNIYGALVSASGGLGAPKETVKLLNKIRGKKR